jgi:hypothetical protein
MSSGILPLTILPEEQKFNGDNLLKWTTTMTQILASKGLLGYTNGNIKVPTEQETDPSATVATPIYSMAPTLDEWNFRDQLTCGHITLNCTDTASLGINTTGTAREAWDSIQAEWGKSTDMRRSHAQEVLNRTIFVEGTDIQEHIKLLRTRKAAVENLSMAVMSERPGGGLLSDLFPLLQSGSPLFLRYMRWDPPQT